MKNVFIIGSKGIPANYGGFETFVEKLTELRQSEEIKYHVACMKASPEDKSEFEYNNARCFRIRVPQIGPAKAVYYDLEAMKNCVHYIEKNKIESPIIYVLACRIGPFISFYKKKIKSLGGQLFVNPDGHEWLRAKWSYPVRKYWKFSEKLMVKHADLLICDSKNIESYIKSDYSAYLPATRYIAYGTDLKKLDSSKYDENKLGNWFKTNNIKKREYYLIVGRFVPENNLEIIITSFMKSNTKKKLVIITNVEHNKFYMKLKKTTDFENDSRINFVGTVYNQNLLKSIRENAFAYIHGHEVGGTNPSLLEALSSTRINLLLNVGFNEEVAKNSALYWTKKNLANLINQVDSNGYQFYIYLDELRINRILTTFSWDYIIEKYELAFSEEGD